MSAAGLPDRAGHVRVAWLGGLCNRRHPPLRLAALAALVAIDDGDAAALRQALVAIADAAPDRTTRELAVGCVRALDGGA